MDETKIEPVDSTLNETEETNVENESQHEESSEETVAELKAKNQSLYERLKKAEGYERNDEGKWSKKETAKPEVKEPSRKSNDFDYGEKAFLTANGIKGSKEFDFVKSELKSSKQSLDSLLENDYFQNKLENFRKLNKTSEAIPAGRRSGGVAIDSVDYWMAKPIEEVPKDMRIKVVNAKLAKEKSKGIFYNS